MKKSLLALIGALCLCTNVWGASVTYTTDYNSTKAQAPVTFTSGNVTFSFSTTDLTQQGSSGTFGSKGQLKLTKAKTTNLTWQIPDGYQLSISAFSVTAAAGGNNTWFAYTNNSGKKDEDGWKQKGTSDQTVTLPNIAFSSATTSIIIEAPASSDLYIKGFSVTYNLVSAAAPNITIQGHANIINAWHTNLNFSDYITLENNPDNVNVSPTTDAEVVWYDDEHEVFVLGHKSGTVSFTISADDVEDKTFNVTTNQAFYSYAANIIGDEAPLASTHNQADAEAVLATFRSQLVSAARFDENQNITCLLENPGFDLNTDWDYGWNNGSYTNENQNGNVHAGHVIAGGAGNTTLPEANIYQTITLPAGGYSLSAKVLNCQIGNANLYVKKASEAENIASTNIASAKEYSNLSGKGVTATVVFFLEEETEVVFGVWHGSTTSITWEGKALRVDDFTLTYLGNTKVNLQVSGTAKWGTFVAPFNVTVPSGVKAYTVEREGSNTWLTRTEVANGEVPAGTPVLLEQEGNKTISQTYYGNATAAVDNSGVLKGVYELTDIAANGNNYLLQYQNETCAFYLVDATKQLGAYRCYLHLENASAPARLDLSQPNEVATALPIVDASANATKILVNGKIVIVRNNKAFDLNGMLVK